MVDVTRLCGHCGTEFNPRAPHQKFCSTRCRTKDGHARRGNHYQSPVALPAIVLRKCERCGIEFVAVTNRARYCSRYCRRLTGKARNRAATHGVEFEQFSRESVFERDGWICQLCGDPVDPTRSPGDPMSATVDHVVPVSLGGDHTQDNCQLAHRACNSSKGNQID